MAEPVHVNDGNQIVQLLDARQRRGLPNDAFGTFAVAEQHIGAIIQTIKPRAERHADADAQPLAKRAGGHVHERQARRRMALEVAVNLPQL